MPTIDNKLRLAVLVKNAPSTRLHLIVGSNDRGMVFFCCEQSPMLTLQAYGLPARCPICGKENPLRGEAHDNQQRQ